MSRWQFSRYQPVLLMITADRPKKRCWLDRLHLERCQKMISRLIWISVLWAISAIYRKRGCRWAEVDFMRTWRSESTRMPVRNADFATLTKLLWRTWGRLGQLMNQWLDLCGAMDVIRLGGTDSDWFIIENKYIFHPFLTYCRSYLYSLQEKIPLGFLCLIILFKLMLMLGLFLIGSMVFRIFYISRMCREGFCSINDLELVTFYYLWVGGSNREWLLMVLMILFLFLSSDNPASCSW